MKVPIFKNGYVPLVISRLGDNDQWVESFMYGGKEYFSLDEFYQDHPEEKDGPVGLASERRIHLPFHEVRK